MDPITTAVVAVLGKYAADAGKTLLQHAGKAVADAAGNLFGKVIGKLKDDPRFAWLAEPFSKNPAGYQAPVEAAVEAQVKADPNFAAELKELLAEFDQAQKSAGVSIVNTGSGDIFTGDNAFKVDTNTGTIIYGGSGNTNTVTSRSGGTDINAQGGTANITGDVVGRDKKTT